MHVFFEGQVLSGRQGHTRGCDTLDGGVIGQIDKQHGTLNRAGIGQVVNEKLGGFKRNAHRRKDYSKRLAFTANGCLPGQLSRDFVVRANRNRRKSEASGLARAGSGRRWC